MNGRVTAWGFKLDDIICLSGTPFRRYISVYCTVDIGQRPSQDRPHGMALALGLALAPRESLGPERSNHL